MMQPQSRRMGAAYDDILIVDATDVYLLNPRPNPKFLPPGYEAACRGGQSNIVTSIITAEARSPAFLHCGLTIALESGQVPVAAYLLSAGAPIVRQTPRCILEAPADTQIPLFALLLQHGWTPNTPGFFGEVLLPRVVTNHNLLTWFLAHGADPNLGPQRYHGDRTGEAETGSCAALETAALQGDETAVRLLLDAGARIANGVPLHRAAGACPPGANPHTSLVGPTREFDMKQIPVMALLVAQGADVNQREVSRYRVAELAIVDAVMAGAVERVKWLLDQGADPEAKGAWGSAVWYAEKLGSEEMKAVFTEQTRARRLETSGS